MKMTKELTLHGNRITLDLSGNQIHVCTWHRNGSLDPRDEIYADDAEALAAYNAWPAGPRESEVRRYDPLAHADS